MKKQNEKIGAREKNKKINKDLILAYALKNAVSHNGKAVEGAVISSLFHEGLKKEHVKDIIGNVKEIVKKINLLSLEEQEEKFKNLEKKVGHRKERRGLPKLPKVKKGKVVMRFSPSPSGPMHVGHALTASLSYLYTEKYGGKFYIQIEDTNPDNIYKPAYKMLKQESKWLFKNKVKIIIQSERLNLYYKYSEKLIRMGKAYVCTCQPEKFRKLIEQKKACPCRSKNPREQLERWKKMLGKSASKERKFKEGGAVLRFKSNLKHKNPAMRDFPLARINETKHALQGKKYRVWPLMNLAVTVDDIELKKTHIIRAKDHRDNAKRQEMIYKALGKEKQYPWTGFVGRINFKDMHLSTTKMRLAIEKGEFRGWDDKRLPTIASLKKQGYKPEAFHKLAESMGISEVDKTISREEFFKLLNQFNK